jgi:hypothetical protein
MMMRSMNLCRPTRVDSETLHQWLVTKDARTAADVLRPIYDNSDGQDGFVCMELPTVALEPEAFDEILLSGQLLHSLDNDIQSAQRIPPVLESLQINLSALIP